MSENNPRRAFLGRSAAATGGIILALGGVASAEETKGEETQVAETLVKLKEHEKLSEVGGFEVIEHGDSKIIVARVEADNFVACSAICTHKGCTVGYEHEVKEFVCPCHGARYALDGAVTRGPAKKPLQSYNADAAVALKLD